MPSETVKIALMISAFNELEVKSGYSQAPVIEKVWNTFGPDFGKMPESLQ